MSSASLSHKLVVANPLRNLQTILSIFVVSALMSGGIGMAQDGEVDPSTLVRTLDNGYFPTYEELPTMPQNYNGAGVQQFSYPTASGGIPYTSPDGQQGLNRLRKYNAIDRAVGFFEDHDSIAWETSRLQSGSFVVDGDWPFFNRRYNPGTAMFKAGPLFLDVVYVGAGFIYSDYTGEAQFSDGEGDGATAIIDLALRGQLRLAEDVYLTAQVAVAYLPLENRIGFNAASAFGGSPNLLLGFNYERGFGSWDVRIYDRFQGAFRFLDLFVGEGEDAFDRAGRYSFGISANESRGLDNDFFNEDDVYFSNVLGASAGTLFLDDDFYFNLSVDHMDYWRGFGFDDHRKRDIGEAELAYRGLSLPFSPSAFYQIYSSDGFDSYYERMGLRIRGRLTDYITYRGEVGYLRGHGEGLSREESLFWNGVINHRLTERTAHSLYFGEDIVFDDITGDEAFSRYIGYRIQHQLSRRLSVSGGAQWSDDEALLGRGQNTQRSLYFAQTDYSLWTHSRIFARVAYEKRDYETAGDNERWIGRLGFNHMLAPQVYLLNYYQYENVSGEGTGDFYEHAVGVSLRKYF